MKENRKAKKETKQGVTLAAVKGHPSAKWRVTFTEGGKRAQKYFKTRSGEKGADAFAESKREKLEKDGKRHEEISTEERRAVIEFRELLAALPESVESPTLRDAVELFKKTLNVRHKSKTIRELVDSFLLALQRRGRSKMHEERTRRNLSRFEKEYGDWLACDVSGEHVTDWLENLPALSTGGKKLKKKLSPRSIHHYRMGLNQLFTHAVKLGAVAANPMDRVEAMKMTSGEIGILSPAQVAALLSNAGDEALPGLALGFFAGIRREELFRLDWSEIDFAENLIEIKAAKSKTASRRLITLRPNLKAWIQPLRKRSGPVMPSEMIWRNRVADALEQVNKGEVKIKAWPHNAARHSFASYHLAAFKDAAALSLEMGHSNTKMIFEHYRALVSPKAGKAFWSIAPIEDGKVSHVA